jgi:TolB-like protein/class 3 adenylate cyclase/Tfp pilus assembly protein PilF
VTEDQIEVQHARHLAAILAMDMAGYSRQMERDEAGTLTRFNALKAEVIEPEIARHRGRLFKFTGDGCMLEFASAADAADFALTIQETVARRNSGLPEAEQIRFRIGINLADVIPEQNEIYGDGVNLAAWLESIAPPGGITISAAVHEQIAARNFYRFVDLGYRRSLRAARLIRVYRLCLPGEEGSRGWASSGVAAPLEQSRLSILALPFRMLGGSPEDEYFAEGLTEDVITELSRIPGSFVIARNTAFAYKDKPIDVMSVGRELNVRYVLEGSVRRASRKVRVNAKLIDAMTEANVWAGRFDSDERDLLELQDELTGQIAASLDYQLTDAEARRTMAERPDNLNAIDLTLRGWSIVNRPTTRENLEAARRLFEAALNLEPDYAHALVGLAETHVYDVGHGYSSDRPAQLRRAEQAILRALALDPRHARGHNVRGIQLRWTWQFSDALMAFERALAHNHNLASAHAQIGLTKLLIGQPEQTFGHVAKAVRLSPRDFNMGAWLGIVGSAHIALKQDRQAVEVLRRAVTENPSNPRIHCLLAAAYALAGRLDEARAALTDYSRLLPNMTIRRSLEGWSDDRSIFERFGRLIEGLQRAGMPLE